VIIRGDNAITAITLYGSNATLIYLGSGTIGTLTLVDSPTINAADNLNSFTVTTLSGSGAPVIKDPAGKLTVTNAITTNNSDVFEWDWQLRQGRAITLGAA
jgi:N-acetylmuramic acid 6-phosphate (MurNAc-6-P) etherase